MAKQALQEGSFSLTCFIFELQSAREHTVRQIPHVVDGRFD
jgi:hypothetical protein